MDNGVHLADVAQELVAEALALAGALHQAGDVDEPQLGRDDLGRLGDLRQPVEPRVGHGNLADVGLDRAKGIVGRLGCLRLGKRIEEGRFADVRQADDAAAEAHGKVVSISEGSRAPLAAGGEGTQLRGGARLLHLGGMGSLPLAKARLCSAV
jgi:hypothetical protein